MSTDLQSFSDFENIFVKPAKDILHADKISHKKQGLLTNGIQTAGNLFVSEGVATKAIQKVIHSEIEKYRDLFKDSEEGLIKNWPNEYSIYGWLVSMKSGGELRAHMHENGWLSGSVYINVPPKKDSDSGNLVVCIDEDTAGSEALKKTIDVFTGTLCLFPASLLHYTIPFEADEDRIVLAFDVVPK